MLVRPHGSTVEGGIIKMEPHPYEDGYMGELEGFRWHAWREGNAVVLKYGIAKYPLAYWKDNVRTLCRQNVPHSFDLHVKALTQLFAGVETALSG
jgi:hypothetical protein